MSELILAVFMSLFTFNTPNAVNNELGLNDTTTIVAKKVFKPCKFPNPCGPGSSIS